MHTADVRINVRLTGRDATDFQDLLQQSGHTVSDLLRAALREYRSHRITPKPDPAQLLAGFVASGAGPEDLSLHVKRYVTEGLSHKLHESVYGRKARDSDR